MLELVDIAYGVGDRRILDGVDLTIAPGECVAVTGPSGSGKTTLLHICLGLVRPDRGRVVVDGRDLAQIGREGLRAHRASTVGIVFQFGELLPELTAWENVVLPGWFAGDRRAESGKRAAALLAGFGIPDQSVLARSLSGGERQRVAVARAVVNEPALVLADEPTGALDRANSEVVARLLFDLPRRASTAVLLVTHDVTLARRADRVLELADGVLRAVGSAPEHP